MTKTNNCLSAVCHRPVPAWAPRPFCCDLCQTSQGAEHSQACAVGYPARGGTLLLRRWSRSAVGYPARGVERQPWMLTDPR